MNYCTQCGKPLASDLEFCTQCGARAGSSTVASNAAAAPFDPVTKPATAVAQSSTSGCRNLAIGAAIVLLTVAALGIGGAIYAYRAAKEKATAMLHGAGIIKNAVKPNADTSDRSSHSPATNPSVLSSSFAPWKPSSLDAAATSAPAPLRKGMLVVTAIADGLGDYESFKEISNIDEKGVTLSYRSAQSKSAGVNSSVSNQTNVSRTVLTTDLASAHQYEEVFGGNDPQTFPGSTAISTSREVLAELKEKGTSRFSFRPDGLQGAISSLVNVFSAIGGADPNKVGDGSLAKIGKEECTLQHIGDGDFAFPVLLNDQPTTLPALRAHCVADDGPADFYILDQPDYPLMLSWKLGEGAQLQVIKIAYPPEPKKKDATKMEQDLAEKKKVEIYGIYFDFASDRLKPESTPVLDEIARAMQNHPDWKLSVSGHTDNVGGDAYNLDLSKRRAAAVKQALVTRYHIGPAKLTTDGYGAGRPIDTNDTLQGRARNRRVELSRE
jgi:outer membrane protein OmpA-like peptidoglycan-associated protein